MTVFEAVHGTTPLEAGLSQQEAIDYERKEYRKAALHGKTCLSTLKRKIQSINTMYAGIRKKASPMIGAELLNRLETSLAAGDPSHPHYYREPKPRTCYTTKIGANGRFIPVEV